MKSKKSENELKPIFFIEQIEFLSGGCWSAPHNCRHDGYWWILSILRLQSIRLPSYRLAISSTLNNNVHYIAKQFDASAFEAVASHIERWQDWWDDFENGMAKQHCVFPEVAHHQQRWFEGNFESNGIEIVIHLRSERFIIDINWSRSPQ